MLDSAGDSVGFEEVLSPLERLTVKDRPMLAFEPLSIVMHFTNVDAVLQKVGEGAVGKGNATLVFCGLCVTSLGDDFSAIELGHQLAEGLEFEIEPEDRSDGFCLGLVDDELLILCVI